MLATFPEGESKGKARGKIGNGMALFFKSLNRKFGCPSPPCFARSLPPRGSREAADNFCLIVRKHDEARGSLEEGKDYPFCRKNKVY